MPDDVSLSLPQFTATRIVIGFDAPTLAAIADLTRAVGALALARGGVVADSDPAASVEAPEQPNETRRRGQWVTPERQNLLQDRWPTVQPVAEIMQALARLPGGPLPKADAIRAYAHARGLRRPAETVPASLRPSFEARVKYVPIEIPQACAIASSPHIDVRAGRDQTEPERVTDAGMAAMFGAQQMVTAPIAPAPPHFEVPVLAEPVAPLAVVLANGRAQHKAAALVPREAGAPVTAPIEASKGAILQWARQRGLNTHRLDLEQVNSHALSLGHPGFVLRRERPQPHAGQQA